MKNMTPKKANLILRIVVISSSVALGWAAIGVGILTVQLQLNDMEMQKLLACSLGVWIFLSILYLVLHYKFRNILKDPEPKPGEPVVVRPSDTYSVFCSTRKELDEYLEMLLSSKYDGYELTNFSRPGQMFAYEKSECLGISSPVSIITLLLIWKSSKRKTTAQFTAVPTDFFAAIQRGLFLSSKSALTI